MKNKSIASEMLDVIISLIPAIIASFIFFRWDAIKVIIYSILFCVLIEYIFSKLILKKNTIKDLSAVVTGILLAMNLPSNIPWWTVLIGSFVAIFIGKIIFGGIGQNLFNPALLARVVLLVSWPALMTTWPQTTPLKNIKDFFKTPDVVTAPTPGLAVWIFPG